MILQSSPFLRPLRFRTWPGYLLTFLQTKENQSISIGYRGPSSSSVDLSLVLARVFISWASGERQVQRSEGTRKLKRCEMSSRRSTGGPRISEQEICELVSKLQSLLPESRRRSMGRASASKLLQEMCSYIKSLHREVDDLSDRLSALMSTMDTNSPQAEIIRSLLR